ncbi:MAG: hypothetical protein ABIL13_07515 [candidate division WOR-3 bacterium]
MGEEYKDLPSGDLKNLPTQGSGGDKVLPSSGSFSVELISLRDRLSYFTEVGGLREIPSDYDRDKDGDWRLINSDNPFEVLYLDYRQIDRIRVDIGIIDRNYNVLRSFWEEKSRQLMMGANRVLLEKKYGKGTIEQALIRLELAYNRLKTDLDGEYKRVKEKKIEEAKKILEPSILTAISDGVLTSKEKQIIIDYAKKSTELTEDEIANIISDYLRQYSAKEEEVEILLSPQLDIVYKMLLRFIRDNDGVLKEKDEKSILELREDVYRITLDEYESVVVKALKTVGDAEREKTFKEDVERFKGFFYSLLKKYGLDPNDALPPEAFNELISREKSDTDFFPLKSSTKEKIKTGVISKYKKELSEEVEKFRGEAYKSLKSFSNFQRNKRKLMESERYELLLPSMREEIINEVVEVIKDEQKEEFEEKIFSYAKGKNWKIKPDEEKEEIINRLSYLDWLSPEEKNILYDETITRIQNEYRKEIDNFKAKIQMETGKYKYGLPVDIQISYEKSTEFNLDINDRRRIIIEVEAELREKSVLDFKTEVKSRMVYDTIIPDVESELINIGKNVYILTKEKNDISYPVPTAEEIINDLRKPFEEVISAQVKSLADKYKIDQELVKKFNLPYSSYISKTEIEKFIYTYTPPDSKSFDTILKYIQKYSNTYKLFIVEKEEKGQFEKLLEEIIATSSKNYRLPIKKWYTENFQTRLKQVGKIYGLSDERINDIIYSIPNTYKVWTTPKWGKFILFISIASLLMMILRYLMALSGYDVWTPSPNLISPFQLAKFLDLKSIPGWFILIAWVLFTILLIIIYTTYKIIYYIYKRIKGIRIRLGGIIDDIKENLHIFALTSFLISFLPLIILFITLFIIYKIIKGIRLGSTISDIIDDIINDIEENLYIFVLIFVLIFLTSLFLLPFIILFVANICILIYNFLWFNILKFFSIIDYLVFFPSLNPIIAWGLFGIILSAPVAFIIATRNLRRSFLLIRILLFILSLAIIILLSIPDKSALSQNILLNEAIALKEKRNYKDYKKAIEYFTFLISINPSEDLYKNRAECYESIGSIYDAINDYTQSIKLNPSPNYYLARARCYEKISDFKKALEDYNLVFTNKPDEYPWVSMEIKRIKEKIDEIEKEKRLKSKPKTAERTSPSERTTPSPLSDKSAETTPSFGVITGYGVLLRTNNSFFSEVIKTLNNGDEVYILDKKMSQNETEATTVREVTVNTVIGTITLNRGKLLNILGMSSGEYIVSFKYQNRELTATIPANAIRKISGKYWYKVKTKGGNIGWVFGDYIKVKY